MPCGRRSQAARRAAVPRAPAAASGEANVVTRLGGSTGVGRLASKDHGHDRLLRRGRSDRLVERALDVDACSERRSGEQHADCVECRVVEEQRENGGERCGGRGSEQVDRVDETALGRSHCAQTFTRGRARAPATRGPRPAHASAKRIPSPPPFVTTATRGPLGNGCVERMRAASRNSESVRARWTPACRKSASTAASELARAAVCEAAARAPAALAPPFKCKHRLSSRNAACDTCEPSRVAEALEIQGDDRSRGVVLPVFEKVIGGDVGLVSEGYEGREAEPARPRLLDDGEAERTALRGKSHVAGREDSSGERRVEPVRGGRDAEAIRADEAAAVRAHEVQQRCLPAGALRADLGEAGRDHAERAHARCEGVSGGGENRPRRHADDCQIDDVDAPRRAWSLPGTPSTASPRRLIGMTCPAKCPASTLRKSSPPMVPRRADAPYTATLAGARNARSEAATADVVAIVDPGDVAARSARSATSPRSHRESFAAPPRTPTRGRQRASGDCQAGSRTRVARFRSRQRVPPVARADACQLRLPASRRQRRTRLRRRQDRAGGRSSRERSRAHSQPRPARRSAPRG